MDTHTPYAASVWSHNRYCVALKTNDRFNSLEKKVTSIKTSVENQESLLNSLSETVANNTAAIDKVDKHCKQNKITIDHLTGKIESLEKSIGDICEEHVYNATHKLNIIFFNVQKQVESDTTPLLDHLSEIIKDNANVEIDPTKITDTRTFFTKKGDVTANPPVMITCKDLKTREFLLNKISFGLRDRDKNKAKISMTDDISPRTRAYNKILNEKAKSFRANGYLAFVGFDTPRVLKCKKRDSDDPYVVVEDIDSLPF